MFRFCLVAAGVLNAALCFGAENESAPVDIDVPSPLNSEIEFGYQSHSGNSDTQSMNARVGADYTSGRHRSSGEWKFYLLYKDGEEDKRLSSYKLKSDYKLGLKTYLYANFKGVDSLYSAYFKDYTLSGGVGYQLFNTETLNFEIELGPGFRYQEPNLDEIDDDDIIFPDIVQEAIFRGNLASKWQVVDSLSLSASVTLVAGRSNSRLDSDISAINDITDDIALKLTHSRQYHDKVPEGLAKADSVFSVNLLFVF